MVAQAASSKQQLTSSKQQAADSRQQDGGSASSKPVVAATHGVFVMILSPRAVSEPSGFVSKARF